MGYDIDKYAFLTVLFIIILLAIIIIFIIFQKNYDKIIYLDTCYRVVSESVVISDNLNVYYAAHHDCNMQPKNIIVQNVLFVEK